MKSQGTLWTILGVIVAVVIAWWLVSILASVLWFVGKLVIVAIVAVIGLFVLRTLFTRDSDQQGTLSGAPRPCRTTETVGTSGRFRHEGTVSA